MPIRPRPPGADRPRLHASLIVPAIAVLTLIAVPHADGDAEAMIHYRRWRTIAERGGKTGRDALRPTTLENPASEGGA